MAAIVSPFCIAKTTEKLKFSSYLAMGAITLVVFCTYYTFFDKVRHHTLPDFNWWPS